MQLKSASSAERSAKSTVQDAAKPSPPLPGDVLRDEFLVPSGITQDQLAKVMNVSRYSINQLVNNKRSVTAEMALRLARVTGMTPEFWLNLQRISDLTKARRRLKHELSEIEPVLAPPSIEDVLRESSKTSPPGLAQKTAAVTRQGQSGLRRR